MHNRALLAPMHRMHQAAVIAQRWVTRLIIGRSWVQILRDAGLFTASLSLSTLCDVSLDLIFNKTWLAVQLEMKQAKYAPHLQKDPFGRGTALLPSSCKCWIKLNFHG